MRRSADAPLRHQGKSLMANSLERFKNITAMIPGKARLPPSRHAFKSPGSAGASPYGSNNLLAHDRNSRCCAVKRPRVWGACQEYILDREAPGTRFDQCLQGFRVGKKAATGTCGVFALCATMGERENGSLIMDREKAHKTAKWIFIFARPPKAWRRRMLRGYSFGGSPSIRVKNSK
jgi:hypothetical protein